jgi:ABC-type antimicrobial peptide transport system permease subunit
VSSLVSRSFAEERFRTTLVALFGAMAVLLATVGMYGVTSRAVSRRTREVGIRVALGATARSVVGMIAVQTLGGVAVGVAMGTVAAAFAARMLTPYLFGIQPLDPGTYLAILGLLAIVSALASWLPARRAGGVDPATVLRSE